MGIFGSNVGKSICINSIEKNIRTIVLNRQEYRIVLTGSTHYKTFWIRDFCMSVPGLLELGKYREVKESIDLILKLRNKDGLVPRIIDSDYMPYQIRYLLNIFGLNPEFGGSVSPKYISEHGVVSVDGNLLTIIGAVSYIRASLDKDQGKKWTQILLELLSYTELNHKKNLIFQEGFSDWQDSLRREGRVSFTNTLYAIALKELIWFLNFQGEPSVNLLEKYEAFLREFKSFFFLKDRVKNFESDERDAVDAAILCVLHDLLSEEEQKAVYNRLKNSNLWSPVPGRLTIEPYEDSFKSWTTRIAGISDYHETLYWPWISAMAGLVSIKMNDHEEATRISNFLTGLYSTHQNVHEVYLETKQKKFIPVFRRLTKTEFDFTWSAACSIKFFSEFERTVLKHSPISF